MTLDLAVGEAALADWTFDEYLADKVYTSRSQLEDLRDKPSRFYLRHVARTLEVVRLVGRDPGRIQPSANLELDLGLDSTRDRLTRQQT